MAKLYKVQLACGHRTSTTAEPSVITQLMLDCPECKGPRTVSSWTGGVMEDTTVDVPVEPVRVEESSD